MTDAGVYEAELKVQFDPAMVAQLEKRLQSLTGSEPEVAIYDDTYFDTPHGELGRKERELRVRRKITSGGQKVLLTYKAAPFDAESRSKQEFEVTVDRHETLLSILKALGYEVSIHFEKRCHNYQFRFDGQLVLATVVVVPELPHSFMEVEIQVNRKEEADAALASLRALLRDLGLGSETYTPEYYTDMVRTQRMRAR